jgi:hypothetical protein
LETVHSPQESNLPVFFEIKPGGLRVEAFPRVAVRILERLETIKHLILKPDQILSVVTALIGRLCMNAQDADWIRRIIPVRDEAEIKVPGCAEFLFVVFGATSGA